MLYFLEDGMEIEEERETQSCKLGSSFVNKWRVEQIIIEIHIIEYSLLYYLIVLGEELSI